MSEPHQTSKEPHKSPKSLSMAIGEKAALQACYMPFIKDGAIFVPTTEKFQLHDEITLHLRLVEEGKKVLISGHVVWLSPGVGQRGGSPGVGLQFTGEHRFRIKQFLEEVLGDLAKQPSPNPDY